MKGHNILSILLTIAGIAISAYFLFSSIGCWIFGGSNISACFGQFHTGTAIFILGLAIAVFGLTKFNMDN